MSYVVIGKKGGYVRLFGRYKNRKDAETKAGLLGLEPTDEVVDYEVKKVNVKGYRR